MRTFKIISLLTIITLNLSCQKETKIVEFRGEERKGIYNETGLLKEWPEDGLELIWSYDSLGLGYGSPVITDKQIFIQGEIDSTGYLFAMNLDGELEWKMAYGPEWTGAYRGVRSAPTVINSEVYVSSGHYKVFCFDTKTGTQKWMRSFKNDTIDKFGPFGLSESIIGDEEKVYLLPGDVDTNVVAMDRLTGEIVWTNEGMKERPAYHHPQIIKLANRNILVHFSAYHMMGFDTETGELLWKHEQTNIPVEKRGPGWGDVHSNTVLFEDPFIYYVEGAGNGTVKLKLSSEGDSIQEIWTCPEFDGFFGGFVSLGDNFYTGGGSKPRLYRLNKESGEITDTLNAGTGAIISAENLLYYYNQKGYVMLIDPMQEKMEEISKFKITKGSKEHFAHPVINKGVLYVRHGEFLFAYLIKEK